MSELVRCSSKFPLQEIRTDRQCIRVEGHADEFEGHDDDEHFNQVFDHPAKLIWSDELTKEETDGRTN